MESINEGNYTREIHISPEVGKYLFQEILTVRLGVQPKFHSVGNTKLYFVVLEGRPGDSSFTIGENDPQDASKDSVFIVEPGDSFTFCGIMRIIVTGFSPYQTVGYEKIQH